MVHNPICELPELEVQWHINSVLGRKREGGNVTKWC